MWINPTWLLGVSSTCPSTEVKPVQQFELGRFVNRTWYSQQQQPVVYQGTSDFFCVTDRYTLLSPESDEVAIRTTWNSGSVSGKPKSTNLNARIPNNHLKSAWRVGYKWMPDWMRGDYWVIAVGPQTESGYAWMIVSGGAPTHTTPHGQCKTGDGINGSGLWLFSSERFPPAGQVDDMRAFLAKLGYDLDVLHPVEHQGCSYDQLQ